MKAFNDILDICKDKEQKEVLINWYDKFNQADRIKRLAYKIQFIQKNKTLDERVNFAWNIVVLSEPGYISTFENGVLTEKARYFLNGVKLLKLFNQI